MSIETNLSLQLDALDVKLLQNVGFDARVAKSLAWFAALSERQLNIEDICDARALQSIHTELRFNIQNIGHCLAAT
jgi:hypothetical protein